MKITKKQVTTIGALAVTPLGAFVGTAHAETKDKVGALDVSVDTRSLQDAISQAESEGVNVFRDTTRTRVGNHDETEKARQEAIKYYTDKAAEIKKTTADYRAAKGQYASQVAENEKTAQDANNTLSGSISTLTALGRGVTTSSKVYSEAEAKSAQTKAEQAVAKTQAYKKTELSVTNYNTLQNSFVGFQTQADMGNIKLVAQDVTVSSADEVQKYTDAIRQENDRLTTYVNGLTRTTGTIPEADRPTYTIYHIKIADAVTKEYLTPVEIPNFTPVPVTAPEVPNVSYAFYDIKQTSEVNAGVDNKDGEPISIKSTTDKVNEHQAMVNQTIAINTTSDPLPAGRWDKYHVLTVSVNLPKENVELNKELMEKQNPNWTVEYKDNKVTFRATDDYLVEINKLQAERKGTIGGIMKESFSYDVPKLYAKLLKDNTKYTFSSDVLVNHEYKANSGNVVVRTDQADPEKHNKNDKGVIIDGKTVFFGTTNNYHLTWDFDQYKGVNIDKEMQSKGLKLIDFYPSDALSFDAKKHKILVQHEGRTIAVGQEDGTFKDAENHVVEGLTWRQVDSHEGIDRKGPAITVSVSGYDHPYYKQYVEQGKSLNVVIPMETKVIDQTPGKPGGVYGGNTFTNVAYQSDFGNIYKSNEVTNTVTTLDPRKDAVLSISELSSLDIKNNPTAEIEHKSEFYYRASGSKIALDVLESAPSSYSITDAFHEADQYDGSYFVESNGDIQFQPGTPLYNKYRRNSGKLPKGSDVTKFTTQSVVRNVSGEGLNTLVGKTGAAADSRWTVVKIDFDQDFLDQIDAPKSTFQMDTFMKVKRTKDVDNVTNIFKEEVNGLYFDSTETVTNTRINDVDTLKTDVSKLKEDVKVLTNNLSVVRRDVTATRSLMEEFQKAQRVLNKQYEKAIADGQSGSLSIRELVNTVKTQVDKQVDINKSVSDRLGKVDGLLEQTNSELTIYAEDVKTDADALKYAVNHGVASGSIKSIKLNDKNKFVVVYNSSKTAINGGPEATVTPVNSEAFAKAIAKSNTVVTPTVKKPTVGTPSVVTEPKRTETGKSGSTTTTTNQTSAKQTSAKPATFTMTFSPKGMPASKQAKILSAEMKPYVERVKYVNNIISEVTFRLVNGKSQRDIIKAIQ